VDELLVFFKGFWSEQNKPVKFNKIFTVLVIKRSEDVWWDAQNKCVVTQANNELEQLITTHDQEVLFAKVAIKITLPSEEAKECPVAIDLI